MRIRLLACAALAFLIAPAGALAADGFKKDTTPLPSDLTGSDTASAAASDGGSGLGRLVFGLVVVVGLVLALRWFVKRANRDRTSPVPTGSLEVVATTPLAQNRAVHLIRVGDELVLVGSAEQGVTQLRVYSAAESRALDQTMNAGEQFVETSSPGVGQILGDLRKRTAR